MRKKKPAVNTKLDGKWYRIAFCASCHATITIPADDWMSTCSLEDSYMCCEDPEIYKTSMSWFRLLF
jgi:hypothetical protein